MGAFFVCSMMILTQAVVQPLPVLADTTLDGGFNLSAVRASIKPVEIGRVLALDESRPPKWRLCQWGTGYSLEGVAPTVVPGDTRVLANAAKEVVVFPGGLAGDGLRLTVHGGVEYGDALRVQGQAWPHLLVEQKIQNLGLDGLASLNFALEFRVDQCVPETDKGMDPALHTAHITAFWTVHNRNAQSGDFQDMIWFGVPLFDARYPVPHGHQAVDAGQADASGKFICTLEGARFHDGPVTIGAWHGITCDLLPLLEEALEASQSKGFLKDTRIKDLAVTGFNLGWEVPGTYDCAVHFKHLKLDAVAAGD